MNRGLFPILLLLAGPIPALTGCGGSEPLILGEPGETGTPASIEEILEHPDSYLDRLVKVEGRIGPVCQQMGCWFYLAQEDRTLLVDLEHGRHFTVPFDSTGRRAVVTGVVRGEPSDLRLVGRSARIGDLP